MPDPRRLRRGAFADELLRAASLRERLPRPPQVAERLRRPRQRAREALLVARAPKLIGGVAVMRERALVVAAHAMEKTAEQQHPWEPALDPRRESVQPALQCRDLTSLQHAFAVIADELRGALVLAGQLQMMDRAIDVTARERALGVTAMQLDDLGGRQELARASMEELGEQRVEAMTGSRRAVTNHEPGSFERGYDLARGASRWHRLVFLQALEERP